MVNLLHLLTHRTLHCLILVACITLLGFGYYLQYQQDLTPCPLCIAQRGAYFIIALLVLSALLHHPGLFGQRIYAVGLILVAFFGFAIAARQVWLQHLPADKIPECGPGLDYILEVFPVTEALQMILTGSGECAKIQWQFLGFSIPEWSLLAFLCLLLLAGGLLMKKTI